MSRWENVDQRLDLLPKRARCPECKAWLHSYKTQQQVIFSIEYGNFKAKIHYIYCPEHPYDPEAPERIRSYRSEAITKVVGRGRQYAYDVMSYIGISRFLQGCQVQEIRAALETEYHIPISASQVGRLSEEFLIRLSCLHTVYRLHLKRLIESQGGYALHLDTSCEDKSSTVLVGLDGRTGWVLLSEKIPSEREEFIVPALKELQQGFGPPRSVMRDMGRAIEKAVLAVFPKVPQRICHFHFLKDVGKDILSSDYQILRAHLIDLKIAPQLNSVRRDLLGPLKVYKPDPQVLDDLLAGRTAMTQSVYRSVDALLVITLIDWILNYPKDGNGLGFPFDHSYLYFYQRCQKAYDLGLRLQARISSAVFKDARLDTVIFSLAKVCDPAYDGASALKRLKAIYTTKLSEFDKLRRVMRFYCDRKAPLSQELGFESEDEIRSANRQMKELLREEKRCLRDNQDPAQQAAARIIATHMEKHWNYLTIPSTRQPEFPVARTNNIEEQKYRSVKATMRRMTGKKDLSQEFERLGAHLSLVQNLENPAFVETVLGSIDNLPEAIADLDPVLVEKQTERFYEDRYGPAYQLRKSIDPIRLLINSCGNQR